MPDRNQQQALQREKVLGKRGAGWSGVPAGLRVGVMDLTGSHSSLLLTYQAHSRVPAASI